MPVPVFEQSEINNNKKEASIVSVKTSGVAILFAIFLVAVSIFTMEIFLRDINKYFNNEYNSCHYLVTSGDYNFFADKMLVSPKCNLKSYEGLRLLVHVDILMPIVIISLIIFLIIRHKKLSSYFKILKVSYLVFIIWLSMRLIGETEYYLMKHHPVIGKYVLLLTIIIILIYLIVLIQKKYIKKPY